MRDHETNHSGSSGYVFNATPPSYPTDLPTDSAPSASESPDQDSPGEEPSSSPAPKRCSLMEALRVGLGLLLFDAASYVLPKRHTLVARVHLANGMGVQVARSNRVRLVYTDGKWDLDAT